MRKIKIKSKRYFEANYSFIKTFFHNLEVLTQRGDVINPKSAWKRIQTRISCTNGDRKVRIKENLGCGVFLWNYFSQNLQVCISCTTGGKKNKVRNYNNFGSNIFFLTEQFLGFQFKHQSSLWRHHFKTGTISVELTSEMRLLTSWYCKRFWLLIQLAALQKNYFQGYLFLHLTYG